MSTIQQIIEELRLATYSSTGARLGHASQAKLNEWADQLTVDNTAAEQWRTAALLKDRTRRAIRDRGRAGESITAIATDYDVPEAFVTQLVAQQLFEDEGTDRTPTHPREEELRRRISWLEGTAMPHARQQENANGFQKGWHAAPSRVGGGEAVEVLAALVPEPVIAVEIPVQGASSDEGREALREKALCLGCYDQIDTGYCLSCAAGHGFTDYLRGVADAHGSASPGSPSSVEKHAAPPLNEKLLQAVIDEMSDRLANKNPIATVTVDRWQAALKDVRTSLKQQE